MERPDPFETKLGDGMVRRYNKPRNEAISKVESAGRLRSSRCPPVSFQIQLLRPRGQSRSCAPQLHLHQLALSARA